MEMEIQVGDILRERYEIQECRRRAPGKTVYIARDRRYDRKVVVDVFSSNNSVMGRDRTVSAWEAYVLGHLDDHPNINNLIEHWEDDQTAVMVCSHLPRGTLQDRITKTMDAGTVLSPEIILKISIEIGRALAHIHEHRFLYRDLQPRNVRFDEWGAVRLVDFDTAVALSDSEMSDMSQRSVIHYMAPELLEGDLPDERADLYSLGATIYEMISGRPPFAGTREDVLAAKRSGVLHPPERDDLPWPLRELVLELLASERGQRPASATEVIRRLEKLSVSRADVERLLQSGESETLEFKASLRMPLGPQPNHLSKIEIERALEHSVLKTLAAFLNTHGGTLIVGVKDDQTIMGIEVDYQRTQGSADGWRRTFDNLVTEHLGVGAMNFIRVELEPWSGRTIAVIRCSRREEPTWLDDQLFIRRTASTMSLATVREAVDWSHERWGPALAETVGVPSARHPEKVEGLLEEDMQARG